MMVTMMTARKCRRKKKGSVVRLVDKMRLSLRVVAIGFYAYDIREREKGRGEEALRHRKKQKVYSYTQARRVRCWEVLYKKEKYDYYKIEE